MGLVQSCALLGVALVPVAFVIACVVAGGLSALALESAVLAGAVCYLAAVCALTTTFVGHRMHAPVQGMLAGMLFRVGLPLAAIISANSLAAPPRAAVTILGVYLVTLVAETALALRLVSPATASQTESIGSRKSTAG